VNQPVARFTPEDYDAIVYAKGALFFDTLRRQMGDDRFFRFLRTYAHDYAYGIAHTEDVARLLQGMGGPEAMAIFRQWILGVLEEQEASRIFPQVSGD
jgi:aminopeptidase N